MDFLPIVLLLVFAVLMAMGNASCRNGGAYNVSRRFRDLGNMRGKTRHEIVQYVGAPTSVSHGHGYSLLQWQVPGYHIALKFDDKGMFAGIAHEYAARR